MSSPKAKETDPSNDLMIGVNEKQERQSDYDVVIIGAGPVGLAAAIKAKRYNMKYIILDKGVLTNSIFHFPKFMRFFTTADLLEIGGHAFPSTDVKPTRQQALDYYRRVTQLEALNLVQHHEVTDISGKFGEFQVSGIKSRKGKETDFLFKSKTIVIATGYFDNPKGLSEVPGEFGPNTSHVFTEPHRFYDHDVVVIGAGNSGAETALELYRHGARVTLVHRYAEPKPTLKYWVGPDLLNRIKEGSIKAVMPAETKEITLDKVIVATPENSELEIPADFVFILTGYEPNIPMLKRWGLDINEDLSVVRNTKFETNIEGIYVIGSAGTGRKTNSIFIENGREHARTAITDIRLKLNL